MNERPIPHNLDAEEAVLGAMLMRREACASALPLLTPSDFYKPAHGAIFAGISAMYQAGDPVDPVTVAERLRRTGELDSIGGPAVLSAFYPPASSNVARYARIVVETRVLRRLIAAGEEVSRLGYEGSGADAVDQARAILAEIDVPVDRVPDDLWELGAFLDQPETRTPWVVPGLIRQKDRIVMVAPEGFGKTMAQRQIAVAVGQGLHPFSLDPIPPVRTLLVDAENPQYLIRQKTRPMRGQRDVWVTDQTFLWSKPAGLDLLKRAPYAALESVLAATRPGLVCIGPLYKLVRGDKKDEQVMGSLLERLHDLSDRYDTALIIEHHAPKEQDGVRKMVPYGSQTLLAWPEFGLGLVPDGDSGNLKVKHWRGARDERPWPDMLVRAQGRWPWVGWWSDGIPREEVA